MISKKTSEVRSFSVPKINSADAETCSGAVQPMGLFGIVEYLTKAHREGSFPQGSFASAGTETTNASAPVSTRQSVKLVCKMLRAKRCLLGALQRDAALLTMFPMHCVRIADVLKMTSVEPFELLKQRNQLVVYESTDDRPVIFVSHQWLSVHHPDPDVTQFRILQDALTNLRNGVINVHTHSLQSISSNENGVKELTINWRQSLDNALIWYDYFSIPQSPKSESAIASIPAYVERSEYVFVLTPPLEHKDFVTVLDDDGIPRSQRKGGDCSQRNEPVWCDYRAWQSRGWCQLEQLSSILKINPTATVVVESARYLYYPFQRRSTAHVLFNECNFTCCQMNHIRELPDNRVEKIPCDHKSVYNAMSALLEWRMKVEKRKGNSRAYRQSRAFCSNMCVSAGDTAAPRLKKTDTILWRDQSGDPLEEFLAKNNFVHARENCGGWSPLRLACLGGHVRAVRSLLDARVDVECPLENATGEVGFGLGMGPILKGVNLVAYLVGVCSLPAHETILDMLIAAGADPYGGKRGIHALFSATLDPLKHKRGMRWLLRALPNFDVDLPVDWFDMKMRPLDMAARLDDDVAVSILIQHGADIVGAPGRSVFWNCCSGGDGAFSYSAKTVYDMITKHNSQDLPSQQIPFDVNERNEVPLPRLARLKVASALRMGPVSYVQEEMLWHGCTPLFAAASRGKHCVVKWLLSLQADPLLTNAQGKSPMEIALERGFNQVVHALEEAGVTIPASPREIFA
eukprot:GEMP01015451.1.p1 GENE.GEMP01015451.1~~GEMP01015451.1.p1  ORF type:complete len:744 (-),score=161.78 GEMP01015451.1:412-2643(-)